VRRNAERVGQGFTCSIRFYAGFLVAGYWLPVVGGWAR
jgi:hypothetical protein